MNKKEKNKKGITLLLVVVILSAILSVSIGIFNLIFGEILISGEAADSFQALYAADLGVERILYQDRVANAVCSPPSGGQCAGSDSATTPLFGIKGCYQTSVTKTDDGSVVSTTIITSGEYRCGSPDRIVKRGFQVSY